MAKTVKCRFCGCYYNSDKYENCPYCNGGKIVTYPAGVAYEPSAFSTVYAGPAFFRQINNLLEDTVSEKDAEKDIGGKIFFLLYKIIYDRLHLKEIEERFTTINVPTKNIVVNPGEEVVSRYFFLKNDIYLERLSDEEMALVTECLVKDTPDSIAELCEFLKKNIYRLLLPDTHEKYLWWPDRSHAAPSDYIVIAFHTLDYKEGETDEIRSNRDDIVYPLLNRIQEDAVNKYGLKVAVIKYNEIPLGGENIVSL